MNVYTGAFGLGNRNERGLEFCQNEEMLIINTTFKLLKRSLYTFTTFGDSINGKVIRNKINYILILNKKKVSKVSNQSKHTL